MNFQTRFSGRPTAVVTGASQGIGRAIAVALAAHGADLVVTGRSADRLMELASSLSGHDINVECIAADLAMIGDIENLVHTMARRVSRIDILVNCASLYSRATWADADVESLDEHYKTNVRGTYTLTKMLLPSLMESRGDIVIVNSSIVQSSGGASGQYAATKHALVGLANSLRAEVNERGVRVLSVYPGRTATPMQEMVHRHENREYVPTSLLQPSDIADIVVACIALPGTAEVTEIFIRPMHNHRSGSRQR